MMVLSVFSGSKCRIAFALNVLSLCICSATNARSILLRDHDCQGNAIVLTTANPQSDLSANFDNKATSWKCELDDSPSN